MKKPFFTDSVSTILQLVVACNILLIIQWQKICFFASSNRQLIIIAHCANLPKVKLDTVITVQVDQANTRVADPDIFRALLNNGIPGYLIITPGFQEYQASSHRVKPQTVKKCCNILISYAIFAYMKIEDMCGSWRIREKIF